MFVNREYDTDTVHLWLSREEARAVVKGLRDYFPELSRAVSAAFEQFKAEPKQLSSPRRSRASE